MPLLSGTRSTRFCGGCRHAARTVLPLVLSLAGSGAAVAVQSTAFEVAHEENAYSLYAEMVLDAPVRDVYLLLADYDRAEELSDLVEDVSLLASPEPCRHRVHSVAELCVLVFCGQVDQVQDVYEMPNREILALTVPEESNLQEGVMHWRLQPAGNRTRLKVFARVVPDFWVPPVIGPWAVKHALTSQVRETAENIERLSAVSPESAARAEAPKHPSCPG